MRAHVKAKRYQRQMRDKAKQGLVNMPDGNFKPYSQCRDDSMRRDYMAGYRVKGY